MTGGGSGGHITPLLAVASELKKQDKNTRIVYVGQRGDQLAASVGKQPTIDEVKLIWAGKLRRYHGEGLRQLLDIKTMLLNIRDVFLVLFGTVESLRWLMKHRPAVIFIKGGFVGLPVGLAAALLRIPYITHDSDALAGLTNKMIARWASAHAVALPKEIYAYPLEKTVTVGVPISGKYEYVSLKKQLLYKKEIGLSKAEQIIFITGGGLGAKAINDAMVSIAPQLLRTFPNVYVTHAAGHQHAKSVMQAYQNVLSAADTKRVVVKDYLEDLYRYSGAADVIVARAGATNMAELAMQGKACVIVPNPVLAGGHQLKNAIAFEKAEAVKVVPQSDLQTDPTLLYDMLAALLARPDVRQKLGRQLHKFAHPQASKELAQVILGEVRA